MALFRQSCCIRAKNVVFGQKVLYSGKWLYSCKGGCNRAKINVFRQSGCNRAKVVVFDQSGCIRAKVDVFRQSGCVRVKVVKVGQSGCIL